MTTIQKPSTRDGILAAALLALADHVANHRLPAPLSIDFPADDEAIFIRVRVAGVGAQSTWLDSVSVKAESNEPRPDRVVFTTWDVVLPDTLTRIQVTGSRPQGLALVDGPVSA